MEYLILGITVLHSMTQKSVIFVRKAIRNSSIISNFVTLFLRNYLLTVNR